VVYQRNADGTLTSVASLITSSTTNYSAVDYQIEVSADGQYIYVGDPNDDTLSVYRFTATDNTLVQVESHAVADISALTLSHDGSLLYTSRSGSLEVYRVATDGSLQLASSTATSGSSDLALSSDGTSLLVAGSSGISRYTLAQTLPQGGSTTFAEGLSLGDSNNDILSSGAGNYNGSSITVSANVTGGSFGFVDGNDLVYDSASGSILYQGTAIATFSVSDDGVLSVTFTAETSSELANQVLHQLSYSNDNAIAGSSISLSVQASDGVLSSASVTLLLRVNSTPQVNSDLADSYSLPTATSETSYSHTLDAALFADADGDRLSWSVSGLPDGLTFDAQSLTISGTALATGTFPLTISVSDAYGSSSSYTVELVVEQIANRAPSLTAEASTGQPGQSVQRCRQSIWRQPEPERQRPARGPELRRQHTEHQRQQQRTRRLLSHRHRH
jgi:hypothetical protein